MLTDQTLNDIIDKVVAYGRTRLVATAGNVIDDGTRLIIDNKLPEKLLSARSVSVVDVGKAMAIQYSFPSSMASLREPGDRRSSRLVPTRAGLKSAPARLVYRYAFGVLQGVMDEMAEKYTDMVHEEFKKEAKNYGIR